MEGKRLNCEGNWGANSKKAVQWAKFSAGLGAAGKLRWGLELGAGRRGSASVGALMTVGDCFPRKVSFGDGGCLLTIEDFGSWHHSRCQNSLPGRFYHVSYVPSYLHKFVEFVRERHFKNCSALINFVQHSKLYQNLKHNWV